MKLHPTYAMAYTAFIMLHDIPSYHFANAAATEDDGAALFEANDASLAVDFTHDVSMQRKLDDESICSDDITWKIEGNDDIKNCAWVRGNPEILCSKKSSEGVLASYACPIACGEFSTRECAIPQCDDNSWFLSLPGGELGKKCNGFLTEKIWRRCYLPVVNSSGDVPRFFAYEYCSKCGQIGNACVHSTGQYDPFVTTIELLDAVDDYCADPEAWITDPKYAKYGPIEEWDVSYITDMSYLFNHPLLAPDHNYDCNPNIGGWDVSSVTDFSGMFWSIYDFNQDLGGWDVSNGKYFYQMFYKTEFNQDIGGWDVSNGRDFASMFELAFYFNQDISGWDVSNGTNFNYMFDNADNFNQDLCGWDIDDSASTNGFCDYAISCGDCSF